MRNNAGTTTRFCCCGARTGIRNVTASVSDTGNRLTESHAYANGSTTTLLAKQENVYDSTTKLVTESRVYEVTAGTSTGNYLRTQYSYDNANRLVKVTQPQGGFQKTLFDVFGRTSTVAFCGDEGGDSTASNLTGTQCAYDSTARSGSLAVAALPLPSWA